jgi:UDP-glucose 4-epimerase
MGQAAHALITGGAGFIGSHLADRLVAEGWVVTLVDDMSLGTEANVGHLLARSQVSLHELSVLDPAFIELVARTRPRCLFHLAANSDIRAGSTDSRVDLERTLLTTVALCEAAGRADVPQIFFASSSAVYREEAGVLSEASPLQPSSFYGAAKLGSEAWLAAFSRLTDTAVRVLRFANVVGSRATHGVIFDFVRRLRDEPGVLRVLGDGTQTKPYLLVDDVVAAIVLVVSTEHAESFATWNAGPTGATSVRAIAERVVEHLGTGARIVFGEGDRGWLGDVPRFRYDSSRLRSLGWQPSRSSDEAIDLAVAAIAAELR